MQTRLRLGQVEQALAAAADYRDIFGKENFFLELMDHGLPIERSVREGLLEVAKKLDLPPLATNDSHYVTKDQAESHAALLCVQSGKTLDDPNRFKFDGDGYYLRSAAEMREYWDSEVPGAADDTLLIAERVESYEEVFAEVDRMPRFPLSPGQTEDDLLRAEVEKYTPDRFPDGLDRSTATASSSSCGSSRRWASPATSSSSATSCAGPSSRRSRSARAAARPPARCWPTSCRSPTSTRSSTACCSSASSTPSASAPPTSTSTSTSVGAAR